MTIPFNPLTHPQKSRPSCRFFCALANNEILLRKLSPTAIMKITNESEYENASERADEIFNAKKGSPEEKELQELLKAIKEYEDDFVRMLRDNN